MTIARIIVIATAVFGVSLFAGCSYALSQVASVVQGSSPAVKAAGTVIMVTPNTIGALIGALFTLASMAGAGFLFLVRAARRAIGVVNKNLAAHARWDADTLGTFATEHNALVVGCAVDHPDRPDALCAQKISIPQPPEMIAISTELA